jgi:hypothetical protein
VNVVPYSDESRDRWDRFVAESCNGTFLHSRRFLSYHGARFEDVSLLAHDAKDCLVGVLPAAVNPRDRTEVVSHPGITYGSLIHARELSGGDLLRALEVVVEHYRQQGFRRFLYLPVPRVFQDVPSEDDLYALFRLGAHRYRCNLSAVIDLARRPPVSKRRARSLKKAAALGVAVRRGLEDLEAYWTILSETLAERHGAKPVHSLEEMRELAGRFPGEIALATAHLDAELVAGAVLFNTSTAVHTQYLAASPRGRESAALDVVIGDCIEHAASEGKRYFSLGTSTEQDGLVLNEGLYTFKAEFGAGGLVHEGYSIAL